MVVHKPSESDVKHFLLICISSVNELARFERCNLKTDWLVRSDRVLMSRNLLYNSHHTLQIMSDPGACHFCSELKPKLDKEK